MQAFQFQCCQDPDLLGQTWILFVTFFQPSSLKGVCHEIFNLSFSRFEPIQASDKHAKVFSNSVSISAR